MKGWTRSSNTLLSNHLHQNVAPGKKEDVGRVLKPGGKFIFFEHGLSPNVSVQRWQRRTEPLFRGAFEGCHTTRDIPALVRQGGFLIEEINEGYVSPFPKSGS